MLGTHRTWRRALGLAGGLVVAYGAGFTATAAYELLPPVAQPYSGSNFGNAAAFGAGAVALLALLNRWFDARWRVLLVAAVMVPVGYIALVLTVLLAWGSIADGVAASPPQSLIPSIVAFCLIPPLLVGWWAVRVEQPKGVDARLAWGSFAALGLLLLLKF